jgi:hypothetical protein
MVSVFSDTRGFTHYREIEVGNPAAACAHPLDSKSKKAIRGDAAPLWIARRKMHADVTICERAEDSICERVQCHIGIGMAGEGLPVWDADPTEGDVVAWAEGMHIQPRASTHIAESGRLNSFHAREIFWCRKLYVTGLTHEYIHLHSSPFGERGVIGKIISALRRGAPMCLK